MKLNQGAYFVSLGVVDVLLEFNKAGVSKLLFIDIKSFQLQSHVVYFYRRVDCFVGIVEGKAVEKLQEGSFAIHFDLLLSLLDDELCVTKGQTWLEVSVEYETFLNLFFKDEFEGCLFEDVTSHL